MKQLSLTFGIIFFISFFVHSQETYSQSYHSEPITSFPWTEGFESTTFPPQGWSILDISGTKMWERSTGPGWYHSGIAAAQHDYGTGGVHATALVTPPITFPNSGTPTLDFWSKRQYAAQFFGYSGILFSTTVNNDISAFTEIKSFTSAELGFDWHKIEISLEACIGQTVYIAFLYSGNDAHRWAIDDITVSHFDSFVDMQATDITPVSGEYALFSTNEQVTVRLKNNSGSPATGFNVKLLHNNNLIATETYTGTIQSMSESIYTFNNTLNLSTAGTHIIKVIVEIQGDQVPANDTATSTVVNLGCEIITTFPFTEGFENNGNNLPSCWTQEFVAKKFVWRVTDETGAYNMPGMQPVQASEGIRRAFFYTNGKDGAVTKLITPPMDITSMSNPVLKFHHVQRHYAGDQDSLKIYYRTSANGNWVFLEKYTEMIVDWTERTIPLPEPSNQYFIAFEAYAEWGASVQIDDIFVGQLFETDIAVKAISPSGVYLGLSAQQQIKATIKNNGRNSVTGFSIKLFFNGNLVDTEIFTGVIPGLGEIVHTFNNTLNLSISGTYTLKVVVDLTGDEVVENNELTVTVKNIVCNAITFPYDEDFEEDIFPPHCWTVIGEWTRLTYGAHGGIGRASYAWWYGSLGWLISPRFSIPANGNYSLEFWSHVYEARFYTYSEIMISTTDNNPSSFSVLHTLTSAEIPESEWIRIALSLNAYSGQDIYIAFRYRNSGGQTGHMWSVDDIKVFNLDIYVDAEITAITTPPEISYNLTEEETVTVEIKNNGGTSISGFQIELELNGETTVTETFNGTVLSLHTAYHTFEQKLNLSNAGTYTITATVILSGDMSPDNDSKSKVIENKVCPPVTYFPWTGDFYDDWEISDCWLNLNLFDAPFKWWIGEIEGKKYAASESYIIDYEFAITPDNWLISPPVSLEANCTLTFKIGSAIDLPAEKYSVLVSTTGIDFSDFTEIYTETLNSYDFTETIDDFGFKTVTVSLSDFNYQTVHIAFRHWDCFDELMLLLTDIKIFTTEEPLYTVTFNVIDENDEDITDAVLVFDGNELSGYIAANISPGTYEFTVSKEKYLSVTDFVTVENQDKTKTVKLYEVGIIPKDFTNVTLYPNPFNDEIYITNPELIKSISIKNIVGQTVKELIYNGKPISTKSLETGIYFITVSSVNGEKMVYRMVK